MITPAKVKGKIEGNYEYFAGTAISVDTHNSGFNIAFFTKITEDVLIQFSEDRVKVEELSPLVNLDDPEDSSADFSSFKTKLTSTPLVSSISYSSLSYGTTYETYLSDKFNTET